MVELGGFSQIQAHVRFVADQPQQEPDLLLADADMALVMAHSAMRQR